MRARLIFNNTNIQYKCPGCKQNHHVPIDGSRGWKWNGSLEKPTITPSVNCLPYDNPETKQRLVLHCHHFITDGKISFCQDCDHELKGQVIELENI